MDIFFRLKKKKRSYVGIVYVLSSCFRGVFFFFSDRFRAFCGCRRMYNTYPNFTSNGRGGLMSRRRFQNSKGSVPAKRDRRMITLTRRHYGNNFNNFNILQFGTAPIPVSSQLARHCDTTPSSRIPLTKTRRGQQHPLVNQHGRINRAKINVEDKFIKSIFKDVSRFCL